LRANERRVCAAAFADADRASRLLRTS
jgi:hypothetical protein